MVGSGGKLVLSLEGDFLGDAKPQPKDVISLIAGSGGEVGLASHDHCPTCDQKISSNEKSFVVVGFSDLPFREHFMLCPAPLLEQFPYYLVFTEETWKQLSFEEKQAVREEVKCRRNRHFGTPATDKGAGYAQAYSEANSGLKELERENSGAPS